MSTSTQLQSIQLASIVNQVVFCQWVIQM